MKGLQCKVTCRFYYKAFDVVFLKDHIYSVVKRIDGIWLLNSKEKKKVRLNGINLDLDKYFKFYKPIKRKSKYEKWEKS